MTDNHHSEEHPATENTTCPVRGCGGSMIDVIPIERARSGQFSLIRIECTKCHERAWRIEHQ